MNKQNTQQKTTRGPLILKGAAMGVAEVIPGVSGGTIALVTGIYERLLAAIKGADIRLLKKLFTGQFNSAWKQIDGGFLIVLVGGMVCGIAIGVFGIHFLMENYPEPLYAFFFGLILASAWYVGRQVVPWKTGTIVALITGVVIAFSVTQVSPAEGSTEPLYLILCGFLAVSALMLPGVSGSFILLLLGMYTVVIGTLKEVLGGSLAHIWILLCFGLGMVAGLIVFSRIMTWMFKRFHQLTLALLAGFMVGSLPKIWPWRVPTKWLDDTGMILETGMPGQDARILSEQMVLPDAYTVGAPHTLAVILSALGGILVILLATYFETRMKAANKSSQ